MFHLLKSSRKEVIPMVLTNKKRSCISVYRRQCGTVKRSDGSRRGTGRSNKFRDKLR